MCGYMRVRACACVREAGWKATACGCDCLAQWITANERITVQTTMKSRCLLSIEALDTMTMTMDDVQIAMAIEDRGEWIMQLICKWDQSKTTHYTGNGR